MDEPTETVEEPTPNPAARLHRILTRAQRTIDLSRDDKARPALGVWTEVFEIDEQATDEPLYMQVVSRLLQLRKLIRETEESLREIENLPEMYFRPFPRIRSLPDASLMALSTDIRLHVRAITEGDLTVLEFCSARLNELQKEPIVNEAELQEIAHDVSVLFDEVKTSNLDAELKTFILDGLEAIRRAIFEYRIRGPKRLNEALAEIVGGLWVGRDVVRKAEGQPLLERFEQTFYRFAAVVSLAADGVVLLAAFKAAQLPSG